MVAQLYRLCTGLLEIVVSLGLDVAHTLDKQLYKLVVLGGECLVDLRKLYLDIIVDFLLHRSLGASKLALIRAELLLARLLESLDFAAGLRVCVLYTLRAVCQQLRTSASLLYNLCCILLGFKERLDTV